MLNLIIFLGAAGIIIVFSIDDRNSFDKLDYWLKNIEEKAPAYTKVVKN